MKDSETLWSVHDRLEQGWCKNLLRNIHGDVCLIGAVYEITSQFSSNHPLIAALKETLADRSDISSLLHPFVSLTQFNDSETTTKQDVLDLVEKTAIRLEEHGL